MGLFSHFEELEQRVDAVEEFVRALAQSVQRNSIDIASGMSTLLALQTQLNQKISAAEVDPAIGKINAQIGVARDQYAAASEVAAEGWLQLQSGMDDALNAMRASVEAARQKLAED